MGVYDRLSDDLLQAMRDKNKVRLSVLRMVKAAVRNAEIDSHRTLSDEEVLGVFKREVKQRKDTLASVAGTDRTDVVQEVEVELAVLQEYLPAELSPTEIEAIVAEVVRDTGATSKADMGKVMPLVMSKTAGRADGRVVSKIVQDSLSSK